MADWKEQYLAALLVRDENEKANLNLYNYCTKFADEKAKLAKQRAAEAAAASAEHPPAPPPAAPAPLMGYGIRRISPPQTVPDSAIVAQLRQELAKSQQERSDLQGKLAGTLEELESFKTRSKSDNKKITQLTTQTAHLTTKVRDREEELKGKRKLMIDVQDENVTLNLQLNVAEEEVAKLKSENQDLVDRWMVKKGEEAQKMNEEGQFD